MLKEGDIVITVRQLDWRYDDDYGLEYSIPSGTMGQIIRVLPGAGYHVWFDGTIPGQSRARAVSWAGDVEQINILDRFIRESNRVT